jgi:outer membrane protein assembly factor BamA
MRLSIFLFCIVTFLLFFCIDSYAQDTIAPVRSFVVLDHIEVTGLKKTKPAVVFREFTIQSGDTIYLEQLQEIIEFNRQRLFSTKLFNQIFANITSWNNDSIIIRYECTETRFFWPIPIYELADRNFNVWWYENNHSLDRINYGMSLFYYNATGQRDPLRATVQFGFSPKFELEYHRPFIDKKQTIGLRLGMFYSRTLNVPYTTEDNILKYYYNSDQFQFKLTRFSIGINWRPKLTNRHDLSIRYHDLKTSDTISQVINRDFFLNASENLRYGTVAYNFRHDARDLIAYPNYGVLIDFAAKKDGFGLPFENRNALTLNGVYARWDQLSKKVIFDNRLLVQANTNRQKSDFYSYRGLGYGVRTARGYENYVINGSDYILFQPTLKYKCIEKDIITPVGEKLARYKSVPFMLAVSLNTDFAYVNDPFYNQFNSFTNRPLYSAGVGLDILYFRRILFQIQYSIIHTGQHGFYFYINNTL